MFRFYKYNWASLVAQTVKNLPVTQETWVRSLVQEDPLELEMATHSSILAWKIPWTEEPGGLQSMGCHRVRHDWVTNTFTHFTTSLLWSEVVLLSLPEGVLHYHSSRMKVSGAHFQKFFIYMHICCRRFLEDKDNPSKSAPFSQDHTQSILNSVIPPFLWGCASWDY